MSTTALITTVITFFLVTYIIRKSRALSPQQRQEITQALEKGATLVDVRTTQEFAASHPRGALNIPLNQIPNNIKKLQKQRPPIIVCCASGTRSAQAARTLRKAGIETINLGGRSNWPT